MHKRVRFAAQITALSEAYITDDLARVRVAERSRDGAYSQVPLGLVLDVNSHRVPLAVRYDCPARIRRHAFEYKVVFLPANSAGSASPTAATNDAERRTSG